MNRRSFLQTLTAVIAAPLAVAAAVSTTTVTVAPRAGLAFHKDAFAAVWSEEELSMDQFRARYVVPAVENLAAQVDARFDILYGWSTVGKPDLVCRVVSA